MTLEQAAISTLGIIWGCLVWMFKVERENSIQREKVCLEHNARLEGELRDLSETMGSLKGKLDMFERCNVENCPYTPETIRESRSERNKNEYRS